MIGSLRDTLDELNLERNIPWYRCVGDLDGGCTEGTKINIPLLKGLGDLEFQ